jgi:hypothetical protein
MQESGRLRPILALGGALLAAAGLAIAVGTVAQANGNGGNNGNVGNGHTPVTLCHFVPAHGGSFIVITVDDDGSSGNANLQGHAGHENDIIPAPNGVCPEKSETPEVTNTATKTAVVENTATATNTPIVVNTPTATNTAAVINTATATNTAGANTATATNTPGGGGGGATSTPQANTATATNTAAATNTATNTAVVPSATSTSTVSGAAGGAAITPAAAVAGASALPSTGTGASGGGPSWYLLGLGLVMLLGGASMTVAAYRQRRR